MTDTGHQPLSAPVPDADRLPAVTGAYVVWPASGDGAPIDLPGDAGSLARAQPNPANAAAVEMYFGLLPRPTPPPKEQSDLQAALAQVLRTVTTLYVVDGQQLPAFRLYYTRLFRLAQLGLQGNAMPDVARASLAGLTDDLIDAEGGRVKNAHLANLGLRAAALTGVFLGLYLALCAMPADGLFPAIGVDPAMAKAFMLLWIGCFGGVWLSYAIRTTTFRLRDLVVEDADRLLPLTRLLFAGLLTMVLGLLISLGFVDAAVGGRRLSAFVHDPAEALLLGLFCGVSELMLPGMVGKRADDLLAKIQ